MSAYHDNLWCIRLLNGAFLAHPRGTQTRNADSAYGWYYKKDALAEAGDWKTANAPDSVFNPVVARRGMFKTGGVPGDS